jgi:hypothetical protein
MCPPMPRDLPQLRQRIVEAVAAIDRQTLQRVCGRNLITGLTSAASPRMDISSTCKLGQKFGVSLPLLTCSPSAWPSRLPCRRGRKSRTDLWIIRYCYLWPVRLHCIFPHYLIKGKISRKKFEHKMCILIFYTTFVWHISHLNKNSSWYYYKCT